MVEISVLIPTYLRPDMLRRSIDSCLAQQGVEVPFEIVVVDNDPHESARPLTEKNRSPADHPDGHQVGPAVSVEVGNDELLHGNTRVDERNLPEVAGTVTVQR